tara:strand:- start:164 stop:814 length:651 start_codon:yes stop_codon:yes gene_type:complete
MEKKKKLCKLILGGDPGKDGGLVVINAKTGKLVDMKKPPRLKKEVDWHSVDAWVKKYRKRIQYAFIEKPNTGGGFAGRTQSISLGESIATLRQMMESNDIRLMMVPPGTWQKVMFVGVPILSSPKAETKEQKEKRKAAKKPKPAPKVKDNKTMALVAATRLFPKVSFVPEGSKKPHDGFVDAALVAMWGAWQVCIKADLKLEEPKKNKKKKGKKNV